MADTNEVVLKEDCGASPEARGSATAFLVLETQRELYAVRWALVKEAGIVSPRDVYVSAGRPEVRKGLAGLPLYYLWELVGQDRPGEQLEEMAAVFLEENSHRMVLVPDRILWRQDAGLRQLPPWLRKAPVVAGVISLPSGIAVVVVEPFRLKEQECLCCHEQCGGTGTGHAAKGV